MTDTFIHSKLPKDTMTPEQVFIHRYDKLSRILDGKNVSDLLDLSHILRQFLIDSPSVVDVVNYKYRIKLKYPTPGSTEEQTAKFPDASHTMIWIGDLPPLINDPGISKDKFLSSKILFVNGNHYSIKQIIKACANKLGGVHFDQNLQSDPDAAVFYQLNNTLSVGGAPSVFRLLHPIGVYVRDTLEELRSCV